MNCSLFQYIDVLYVLKIQNNTTIESVKMKLAKSIQDVNDKYYKSDCSTMSPSSVVHPISTLRRCGDININFGFNSVQDVSSEYGYELLIYHLEKEHTVANLLFFTEYVQVKTVLEYKFDIFTQLIDNKTEMRFDVEVAKMNQYFLIKQDKQQQKKQEHNQDNNVTMII